MIEEMLVGGSIMVLFVLEIVLNMGIEEEYFRIFVILMDGYVMVEKEVFDFIWENFNEANFFVFGIG